MKRTNFHLTDEQLDALRAMAKRDGLTVAEHLRRAVDKYRKSHSLRAPRRPPTKGLQ